MMTTESNANKNTNHSTFFLSLFNVPKDLVHSDLSVAHDNIASWQLMGFNAESNDTVATIKITTKIPCSQESLEGEVVIDVVDFEVQGVDVYIEDTLSFAKLLWSKLGNVPVNDDNEIQEDFLHFESGEECHDIWLWFEREFDVSVVTDLMNLKG